MPAATGCRCTCSACVYARKTYVLNNRLNNELEREVEIIARARRRKFAVTTARCGHWRIKLSNFQAANFCLLNVFVMGLIATALLRCCLGLAIETGQIFAVLGYVTMFVIGLGSTPALVQQLGRLRDITHRIQGTTSALAPWGNRRRNRSRGGRGLVHFSARAADWRLFVQKTQAENMDLSPSFPPRERLHRSRRPIGEK